MKLKGPSNDESARSSVDTARHVESSVAQVPVSLD
jgi:hypothetical protein